MATATEFRDEPHGAVRSRVNWGPILGGAAIAFALYFMLNLLGTAIGLSIEDPEPGAMAIGAGIWATVAILIALFVGGWVATRFSVGLDQMEAALHGAIVWGIVFILLLWLVSAGMGMGFNMMLGAARGEGGAAAQPQQQQQQPQPGQPGAEADPLAAAGPQAQETAAQAAWWAFIGTLLSIGAAIGGAVAGNRPGQERTGARYAAPGPAPGPGRRAPAT